MADKQNMSRDHTSDNFSVVSTDSRTRIAPVSNNRAQVVKERILSRLRDAGVAKEIVDLVQQDLMELVTVIVIGGDENIEFH